MVPSGRRTPNFRPALWLAMMVCANQLVRSSGPSTVSRNSFCALIWSSQLIGGMSSRAAVAAFLKASVTSASLRSPEPERTRPSRISNQRPTSSSRALIWATRFRSLSRAAKAGWRQAESFSSHDSPHRMSENFVVAMPILASIGMRPIGHHRLSCDLHPRRAGDILRRPRLHTTFDLPRARDRQRNQPANEPLVSARLRQRKAEAAENALIPVEDRRRDADTARIDLAVRHAGAGAPQGGER